MRKIKLTALFLAILVLFGFWGWRVYKVNHIYPHVEAEILPSGETYEENGICYRLTFSERLSLEAFIQTYPGVLEQEPYLEEWLIYPEYGYVMAELEISNETEKTFEVDYHYWAMEGYGSSTYDDLYKDMFFNEEKKKTLEPGEQETYLLCFFHNILRDGEEHLIVYKNLLYGHYAYIGWDISDCFIKP